jgi:hypothetical protein
MMASLVLNRMIIVKGIHRLYDESFHVGVNIIHGDNGAGKSTLADFIFFGLGGDLREWKPHASLADYVLLEVKAQKSILTLRRDVSSDPRRPMQLIFEPMERALQAGPTDWQALPYLRPEGRGGMSFSQLLFRAMGIPEAISDGSSNITMHQVLRLIYADQMTPIQRIFRAENFDTWQTRQAVGELMCGVGGYDLYDAEIQARELSREHSEISLQLRNLMSVAASYGDRILPEFVQTSISGLLDERKRLLTDLTVLLERDEVPKQQMDEAVARRREIQREYGQARKQVSQLEDRIETLKYEIEDAQHFLDHLSKSLEDFDDAHSTFSSLGHVRFEFCPACFAPTTEAIDAKWCHLCGEKTEKEPDDTKVLAVRLDLEMQLRESTQLQHERVTELETLSASLRTARSGARKAATSYELVRGGSPSGREAAVAELSRKVGFLDSEIEVLHRRLALAEQITRLSDQKENLNGRLTKLKDTIAAIIAGQSRRKMAAYTRISNITKHLLENDLPEQSDFGTIETFTFDFAGDWMAINDDKNRSGSASGIVLLKNSFHLGLLLASVQDAEFFLPRWMLFDNIEDKGMVQERSWHFQRLMISEAEASKLEKQIIFTTSKIAPELAKSKYVVGRKYTKARPVLEFSPPTG